MRCWLNQWCLSGIIILIVVAGCADNLKKSKRQSETIRNIGEAYLIEGNYTAALRELLKAEKIYPDDAILQNYLGLGYDAKEHYQEAVTHFKKALDIQPDYALAYNNLGATYLKMKEWDAAINVFKKLSANILYSTPHFANLNLGWAYYNKYDYTTSADYYQKVIKHYQDGFTKDLVFAKALRGLGKTYLATGNIGKAEKAMEEALSIAPDSPLLSMDVAKIRETLGKREQAIAAYRKVIKVAPDSELAVEAKKALSVLAPAE
ncbi:MAG: tetratricopeptide repeat protein [Thermodesulfobacteriota bacterium]|nr:tetratricopeptide repeat protein [Thermodesulfobacteriota bacterium]